MGALLNKSSANKAAAAPSEPKPEAAETEGVSFFIVLKSEVL